MKKKETRENKRKIKRVGRERDRLRELNDFWLLFLIRIVPLLFSIFQGLRKEFHKTAKNES